MQSHLNPPNKTATERRSGDRGVSKMHLDIRNQGLKALIVKDDRENIILGLKVTQIQRRASQVFI